tara:strand:- start:26 stop:607 length:582 start_codon:yes stop_codon:yes gene_type:complete
MPEETTKNKITFADLDIVLKIAPIVGLALLTYLQTLFPSKAEFDKLNQHLIQMDKKMTEMNVLHNKQVITDDIKQLNERVRSLELQVAKHNAESGAPSFNWSPMVGPRNSSTERNTNSNRQTPKKTEKPSRTNNNVNKNAGNKNAANRNKNNQNKKLKPQELRAMTKEVMDKKRANDRATTRKKSGNSNNSEQ